MIVKELDAFISQDRLVMAGREAEEQMAFYLRRAFGKDKNLLVLNGLRLVEGDDAAQIDHLIIHRYGFLIVESKSIATQVDVNEHGEWIRWYGNARSGMPSPIEQARRQAEFLHEYLKTHGSRLLSPSPGFGWLFRRMSEEQGAALREKMREWFHITTFGGVTQDVLVAISDSAIIERPDRPSLDEVCKADQIPGHARDIIARYRKANTLRRLTSNPFDTKDVVVKLSGSEMSRIAAFLSEHHRPLAVAAPRRGDVRKEPQVVPPALLSAPTSEQKGGAQCALCGKPVSEKVEQYCRDASARFGGKVYCITHQRQFPK